MRNYVYGVIKIFVLCKSTGGSFAENIETTGIGYFNRDELPANLATEKTTAEQIQMCFDANYDIIGKRSLIKIRNRRILTPLFLRSSVKFVSCRKENGL